MVRKKTEVRIQESEGNWRTASAFAEATEDRSAGKLAVGFRI
jgi:hypothetical protein